MKHERPRLISPRSWPIAAKLASVLLLTAAVPIGLAVAFAGFESRHALELKSRQNLELLAGVTASRLDQLISDTQSVLSLLARDEAVVGLCSAASDERSAFDQIVARKFEDLIATNDDFASVFVADAKGIGLAGTHASNIGMDFTFREYFRNGITGEAYISDLLVGSTSKDPGVYFSAPVRRDDGGIIGVAVLKLNGERIWEMIDDVSFGEHGRAILINDSSVIIGIRNRDWLFHSTRPLTAEQVAAIDPKASYGIDTIKPLPLTGLSEHAGTGTANFTAAIAISNVDESEWVAGYRGMQTRPWGVVVVEPASQFAAPVRALRRTHGIIAAGVTAVAAVVALALARNLVRPLLELTGAANRLAEGDMTARAKVFSRDEVGRLAIAFNAMVPKLQEHVTLKQAMDVAVQVQQGLLPSGPPDHPRLEIFGRSIYCDETGGDYYDFIDMRTVARNGDKRLLIAVGDVMGHGIGSALLMASCRGALRAEAQDAKNLADMLMRVNRVIAADSQHGLFITLALLELDPPVDGKPGSVRYASGGHDPTVVYRPGDGSFMDLEGGGIPIGIDASSEYEEYRHEGLRTGDVLFIGTDGIWESRNPAGEMYGKDRIRDVVKKHAASPLSELGAVLERDLIAFRASVPQHDDVTYVAIRLR